MSQEPETKSLPEGDSTTDEEKEWMRNFIKDLLQSKAVIPFMRVERSSTIAVPTPYGQTNYEKMGCEVQIAPTNENMTLEGLEKGIREAQEMMDKILEDFKKKQLDKVPKSSQYIPKKPLGKITSHVIVDSPVPIPKDGWSQWKNQRGEMLNSDMAPDLKSYLVDNNHLATNPLRCSDGYNYWLFNLDDDRIQRAKRIEK